MPRLPKFLRCAVSSAAEMTGTINGLWFIVFGGFFFVASLFGRILSGCPFLQGIYMNFFKYNFCKSGKKIIGSPCNLPVIFKYFNTKKKLMRTIKFMDKKLYSKNWKSNFNGNKSCM